MLRDEEIFHDAFDFVPERYQVDVSPELAHLMDPDTYVFGFGRRRCPGLPFASSSVWLAIASILACFRVERARNLNGREIVPERRVSPGAIQYVKITTSYECQQVLTVLLRQTLVSIPVQDHASTGRGREAL